MLLTELPNEILCQIFDYIPSLNLWCNVRCLCKMLYNLLNNNNYWFRRAQVK